jgi:hypothetical protein
MKKISIVLIILFCTFTTNLWAVPVQWSISDGGNSHWYDVILDLNGISWTDAQHAAYNKGGYLATITSEEENNFVFNLSTSVSDLWFSSNEWMVGPWLGGTDDGDYGNWRWINDESWVYTNWLAGQPDNWRGNENYLIYWGIGEVTPTWNDFSDIGSHPNGILGTQGYVVEWNNQVPEPATLMLLTLGGLLLRRRK